MFYKLTNGAFAPRQPITYLWNKRVDDKNNAIARTLIRRVQLLNRSFHTSQFSLSSRRIYVSIGGSSKSSYNTTPRDGISLTCTSVATHRDAGEKVGKQNEIIMKSTESGMDSSSKRVLVYRIGGVGMGVLCFRLTTDSRLAEYSYSAGSLCDGIDGWSAEILWVPKM